MSSPLHWRIAREWLFAVAAAGAILFVAWWILAHGTDQALWPWAERNQGALTFVALVIAIVFALAEQRRANTETARRSREYVAVVLQLADSYLTDLRVLASAQAVSGPQIATWNHSRGLKRKTLDLLRQTCPPDHRLVLAVTELDQAFECPFHQIQGNVQLPAEGPMPKLTEHLAALTLARKSVAALA
jgi:hypothetical protein